MSIGSRNSPSGKSPAARDARHRPATRDLALGLSLANMAFLDLWARSLPAGIGQSNLFFYKALPSTAYYLALVMNVTLLGILLAFAVRAARGEGGPRKHAPRLAVAMAAVTASNALRFRSPSLLAGSDWSLGGYAVVAVALIALLLTWWRVRLSQLAEVALLALVAFVPVTFSQAAHAAMPGSRTVLQPRPLAGPLEGARQPQARVALWLFDEFDYRLAFESGQVHLPELDRLRQASVWATDAVPPSRSTQISVPALLTGQVVPSRMPLDPENFATLADGVITSPWNGPDSLFSRVRDAGFNTSVSGWYFPYCRAFSDSLVRCSWEFHLEERSELGLVDSVLHQWRDVFFTLPLTYRFFNGEGRLREARIGQVRRIQADATAALSDPSLALVYMHIPVPHPPCLFDSRRAQYSSTVSCGYESNLTLVDRIVADLRRSMETAAQWDSSIVILTSDHPWRRAPIRDERVPFIVKMPHQARGIEFQAPMSTLLLYELIPELLDGRLQQPDALVEWVARHQAGRK